MVKCLLEHFWSHLMCQKIFGELLGTLCLAMGNRKVLMSCPAGTPAEPTVLVPSIQGNPADLHSSFWFSLGCAAAQSVHPASWRHAAPECHRLVQGRTPKDRGVCKDGPPSRSGCPGLRGVVGCRLLGPASCHSRRGDKQDIDCLPHPHRVPLLPTPVVFTPGPFRAVETG